MIRQYLIRKRLSRAIAAILVFAGAILFGHESAFSRRESCHGPLRSVAVYLVCFPKLRAHGRGEVSTIQHTATGSSWHRSH
jgi:hypothetical protein